LPTFPLEAPHEAAVGIATDDDVSARFASAVDLLAPEVESNSQMLVGVLGKEPLVAFVEKDLHPCPGVDGKGVFRYHLFRSFRLSQAREDRRAGRFLL